MRSVMQLEDFFDFIGDPVEAIRLKGRRIDLEHVVHLHQQHMTPLQIACHFSCPLEAVQVHAAITYYLSNRPEVDAYIARNKAKAAELRAAWEARGPSDLRKRLMAAKAARLSPVESPS